MESDCYAYPPSKRRVIVSRNEKRRHLWDLRIEGELIREAYYTSAEEAVLRANAKEFGNQDLNKSYSDIDVPGDLHYWERCSMAVIDAYPTYYA